MRKYYLDNIRSLTIILVVIYHVVYIFNSVTVEGIIGPITNVHWQDVIQYVLYPWFMLILFIISGMCAKYYLDKHSERDFIKARTRKLLVPSTIGVFVFGWAQGYFNMLMAGAFDKMAVGIPAPVMYLILSLSGIGVLWTIQVMWILSMFLLLVRKLEKGRLLFLGEKINIIGLVFMVIPVWIAAQILNTPVIVVYRFGIYGFAFLLGYYVFSHEKTTDCLKKYCVPLALIAIVLGVAYTYFYYGSNYAVKPNINSPLAIAYAWFMCLAIIGCMKYWADKTNLVLSFISKKSFGLYVFHYLAISISAYYLTEYTQIPGVVVYILVLIAAFVGGFLISEIISRIPILRWCILGIKKEKKLNVQG